MDFIFVHGAPGCGKSSLSKALQAKLNSPWFEFGWIPEFRQKKDILLTYKEEESFTFETLCLVIKNYVRHGFENVIVSDLRDPKLRQLQRIFSRYRYLIVTLWVEDEELLKARVLDETRSSGYRDWQASLQLNQMIQARPLMNNEIRINSTHKPVKQIVEEVLTFFEEGKYAQLPKNTKLPPLKAFCDTKY